MFRNYYHYFIAGLPEIYLDENEINFSMLDFKQVLKDELFPEDYRLAQLLFLPYDNKNLLLFLEENYQEMNKLGNFSLQDFEEEFSDDSQKILPPYMYDFVRLYKDEEAKDEEKSWENILTEMYYDHVLKNRNTFLKQWFTFNRDLKNILTGLNCRKYDLEVEKQLIGTNWVSEQIARSNAKDFGLSIDLPFTAEVIALAEKDNFLAREKGLDQLRWAKVEELTLFDYFSIEVVLAYILKLDMAYRWLDLDEETGRQMFRKIINTLKSSYEFPKEFALNGKNK
ncbi:MAG: DUF2764 family protein [Bacteroidales bacterium]|jgi:hypothetical protein|nr:DUF2764 family protein [Bacteroidales bacterium]